MERKINIKKASEILKNADKIILISHRKPDGDTLGSAFSLCEGLKSLNKEVKVTCVDEISKRYLYLKTSDFLTYDEFLGFDISDYLLVSIDCAEKHMISDKMFEKIDEVDLSIDHHISNSFYAKSTCLYPDASATGEVVFEILKELNINFTKQMANALYTAISTDCGCFKFSNTTSKTHKIVSEIMEYTDEVSDLNKYLFDTKSLNKFKFENTVLENIEFYFENNIAFVSITKDLIEEFGAGEDDISGISSLPIQIEGVKVAVTLKEGEEGIKISARSASDIDVSLLCSKTFGGGGHKKAAGGYAKGKNLRETKEILLNEIEKLV